MTEKSTLCTAFRIWYASRLGDGFDNKWSHSKQQILYKLNATGIIDNKQPGEPVFRDYPPFWREVNIIKQCQPKNYIKEFPKSYCDWFWLCCQTRSCVYNESCMQLHTRVAHERLHLKAHPLPNTNPIQFKWCYYYLSAISSSGRNGKQLWCEFVQNSAFINKIKKTEPTVWGRSTDLWDTHQDLFKNNEKMKVTKWNVTRKLATWKDSDQAVCWMRVLTILMHIMHIFLWQLWMGACT